MLLIPDVKEDDDTPYVILFVVIKFKPTLGILAAAVTELIELLLYLTNAI